MTGGRWRFALKGAGVVVNDGGKVCSFGRQAHSLPPPRLTIHPTAHPRTSSMIWMESSMTRSATPSAPWNFSATSRGPCAWLLLLLCVGGVGMVTCEWAGLRFRFVGLVWFWLSNVWWLRVVLCLRVRGGGSLAFERWLGDM